MDNGYGHDPVNEVKNVEKIHDLNDIRLLVCESANHDLGGMEITSRSIDTAIDRLVSRGGDAITTGHRPVNR